MVNLKRKNSKSIPETIEYEPEEYPYGFCLDISPEESKKLDLSVSPKQEVSITAKGFVKSINIHNDETSYTIQITDIDITPEKKMEDMPMKEYAKKRGKAY